MGRALDRFTAAAHNNPEPTGKHGEAGHATDEEILSTTTPMSSVPRHDVFVTTKIHPRDFGSDRLRDMVKTSVESLKV